MNYIKKIFSQLRIQMTVVIMLLVFFACFMLSLLAGHLTESALKKQAAQNTEALLSQVIRNVEYYLDDMESLSKVVNGHHSVLRLLLNDASTEAALSTYYEDAKSVRTFLNDLSRLRSEIMSITIAGENGSFVGTQELNYTVDQMSADEMAWYNLAMENSGNPLFMPPHIIKNLTGNGQYVISLVKALSLGNAPPSGAMSINLTLETLRRICSNVNLGNNGYVYIVDGSGNFIYHPDSRYLQADLMPITNGDAAITRRVLNGESNFVQNDKFIVSENIKTADYHVVGVVPNTLIVGAANTLRATEMWIGLAFSVLIAAVVGRLLLNNVFHPLGELKGLMKKARGGNMDVRAIEIPRNEIGELGAGFNAMLERIRLLITSNAQKEKEKRKAELDALQAQINPHFLYNTLDSIVWMAHYQPDIAASMADSLAKLFRLMLGGGEDFVPLSQEIEHVSQYLSIQKLRYASKFSYKVDMEPSTVSIPVPKLILQPLVENAIYHGIKPARKSCNLLVKTMLDGDHLVLIVGDDGVGMSPEKSKAILLGDDVSEKHMGGIGVKNINERISLHYGEGYGISYYCMVNIGTLAILTLPAGNTP
ncbi:MAG: sensor histidine kinase [Clostridia bacterium]